MCRFCHLQWKDLENKIHNFTELGSHENWTEEEYDRIMKSLSKDNTNEEPVEFSYDDVLDEFQPRPDEEVIPHDLDTEDDEDSDGSAIEEIAELDIEEDLVEKRGLRSECPFNRLSSFHCVNGLPPDVMHDVMEGIIPSDLLSVNRILEQKGWFSITKYNEALERFQFAAGERSDKPYPLPTKKSVRKLSGKAVSNWGSHQNEKMK